MTPDPDYQYLPAPDHSDDGDPEDQNPDRQEWLAGLKDLAEREREWRQSR